MGDLVTTAVKEVDRDLYWREPDESVLHQITKPELIARMLRLLEVPEGSRLLEVGTGSGYSTALLSVLVGPQGTVISVDIDREMVDRATSLLERDGRTNVQVLLADGRLGYAPRAPYDRLVAWASAPEPIPDAWSRQVVPGGLIVVPIRRDAGQVVARLRVTSLGEATIEQTIEAGFIPLTGEPFRPWERTPPTV